MYCGRVSDGIFTMIVTDLFIGVTAANWLHRRDATATYALGSLAALFYLGNVVGGYNAALIANDRDPQAVVERWRPKVLVPPDP